jgi:hypothetical protein
LGVSEWGDEDNGVHLMPIYQPYDYLSRQIHEEVAITGTVTLTSAAFGRMHVISGTTANYTITLPAVSGNAGQIIGFRVAPIASATRIYTLDGNSTETIDAATTRMLWAHEVAILLCDGTEWNKIGGHSVPMACILRRETTQSIANTTWTQIVMTTSVSDNTSSLAVPLGNTTSGRAVIIRPGNYAAQGFASLSGVTAGVETNGGVVKNAADPGDNPNSFTTISTPASGNIQASASAIFSCAAGDWIGATVWHQHGSARDTRAVATVYPSLSVVEIPAW